MSQFENNASGASTTKASGNLPAAFLCPVYCQFCTRSYAVGQDTLTLQKDRVAGAQNWESSLEDISAHPQVEDVVLSGGDVARLKAAIVTRLRNALLDIPHVRRVRLATKSLCVEPIKVLSDEPWFNAIVDLVKRGRPLFKDVCIHTHFNHPREITPMVEAAMRRFYSEGIYIRDHPLGGSTAVGRLGRHEGSIRAPFSKHGRTACDDG